MNENEELELDLNELDTIESNSERKLKVKNRFTQLSDKVKTTAQERDEALNKLKAEAEAKSKLERERDFFKDFSQISSKYPQASQHQDKILERVSKGYSPKAAALEVLEELGQLQAPPGQAQAPRTDNPAGGSASTSLPDSGEKRLEEMTQEERRNAIIQADKEGMNLFKF